jgi:hypothetical protein
MLLVNLIILVSRGAVSIQELSRQHNFHPVFISTSRSCIVSLTKIFLSKAITIGSDIETQTFFHYYCPKS